MSPEIINLKKVNLNQWNKISRNFNKNDQLNDLINRTDIWSLGCLLYELYTGDKVFEENDWASIY